MNIKSLRKNYKTLSLIERHSLFISSDFEKRQIRRKGDCKRIAANASGNAGFHTSLFKSFVFADDRNYSQSGRLDKLATCLARWKTSELTIHSRLALYFYFVYADAWKVVCEQMKIDSQSLTEMMFPDIFILWRINLVDEDLREMAFTEDEARNFVYKFTGAKTGFEMTLENKIAEFRDFLESACRKANQFLFRLYLSANNLSVCQLCDL